MLNLSFELPRHIDRRDSALAAAVVVSFVACYAGVLASLVRHWSTNDMYTHGYLIPAISAYLLWERRADLAKTAVEPDPLLGGAVLGLGLLMQVAGALGGVQSLAQLSLVVALCGVVLSVFGRAMMRQTIFPLLFLVFMIPVWEVLTNRLHAPFQLYSAQLGAGLLSAAGVPIRINGILIELPNITLEVAQACSGVNFLVAILALALPQAYLMLGSPVVRVLVAVWAVVVALLTNGFRVAVIGAVAYNDWSGADIHGPAHVLQGLFVAVFGFFAVFVTIVWLSRRFPRVASDTSAVASEGEPRTIRRHINTRTACGVTVLLLLTTAFGITPRAMPVEPAIPLASFPQSLGPWFATIVDERKVGFRTEGADEELSRTYLGPGGLPIALYVAYFTTQTQGRELVTERTLALESQAAVVRLDVPNGPPIEVNEVVRRGPNGDECVIFWYDVNRRPIASGYRAKVWTTWEAFARSRSNGALVMVRAAVAKDGDRETAINAARSFARITAQQLDGYLAQ